MSLIDGRQVARMRAALLATLLMASCITHNPVRTFDEVNKISRDGCAPNPGGEDTSIAALQAQTPDGNAERARVSCVSEERHQPTAPGKSSLPHRGFNLHVFEFDDDGVAWNRAQQSQSFDALERELAVGPSVVLVFVHGWKNDASVCNGNLSCFREVLEILSKGESLFAGPNGTPRQVIGVYIGWRGGTIPVKGLNATTFWSRKHTAHVIGDNGGVTAVIERLRTIVAQSPYRPSPDKPAKGAFQDTSLVFVGHSFGGALLFSALSTSLNASVGAAIQASGSASGFAAAGAVRAEQARPVISDREVRVESSGDLVVLINPAMEASRFGNLAYTRNLAFRAEQIPIFMTLASEADWAVGGFFPVGQVFGTLSRAARSRDFWFRMDKGFGLYEPYHTHRLVVAPRSDLPRPSTVSGTCRCKSNLASFGDALIRHLEPLYDRVRVGGGGGTALASLRLAAYQEMLYSRLEPVRDVDPNNPFVMASVDPAIINGHSDIFNPAFMDFLIEFVIRSEIKRSIVSDYGQERKP